MKREIEKEIEKFAQVNAIRTNNMTGKKLNKERKNTFCARTTRDMY